MVTTPSLPAQRIESTDAFAPVYCKNRKCDNGRPIGRMVPGRGGIIEFCCPVCSIRRVVVDANAG